MKEIIYVRRLDSYDNDSVDNRDLIIMSNSATKNSGY